jgi:V8-like Glu-specific endopeptidase
MRLLLDVAATRGSSGSPVLASDGSVVGMVVGGPPSGGAAETTWALPASAIAAALARLAQHAE